MTDGRQLASELLTAYWTALDRDTDESWTVFRDCLLRAKGDGVVASHAHVITGDVILELLYLVTGAVKANAATYEIEYQEVAFATLLESARIAR